MILLNGHVCPENNGLYLVNALNIKRMTPSKNVNTAIVIPNRVLDNEPLALSTSR